LPAVLALEEEICGILSVTPADLFDSLHRAIFEEHPVVTGRSD